MLRPITHTLESVSIAELSLIRIQDDDPESSRD